MSEQREQHEPGAMGSENPKSQIPNPQATPAVPLPEEKYGDGPPERYDVSNLHTPIMREKLDPRDGFEPVPLWLVSLFGAVLFWGGWYLATYSGDFRADVYDSDPAARYRLVAPPPAEPVDPMVLGRQVYAAAGCAACHQAGGEGLPGVYPPLAGSEWVLGEPAHLQRITLQGLETPRYATVMPGFPRQSDQRIAAVLTYIRNEWGNTANEITPESVAATRQATAGRTDPWTESELLAITQDDLQPQQEHEQEHEPDD